MDNTFNYIHSWRQDGVCELCGVKEEHVASWQESAFCPAICSELEELINLVKPDYETRCRLFDLGKKSGTKECIKELKRLAAE